MVQIGDLVNNREPRDRDTVVYVRELERQAVAAGGRVVVILGDHDVQNLPSLWGELWPEERGAGLPAWCRVVLAVERTLFVVRVMGGTPALSPALQ